jgi:hypothetical protein
MVYPPFDHEREGRPWFEILMGFLFVVFLALLAIGGLAGK